MALETSGIEPRQPIIGLGGIAPCADSLYNDTFPEIIGSVDSGWSFMVTARQASAIPRTESINSPICSGFSGLPKHRQSESESGVAPTATILRTDSITALTAPQ